eukprot:XP_001705814.1 Hypothetical protein GL50803_36413 [Giardia lamblia ATCC 50803]
MGFLCGRKCLKCYSPLFLKVCKCLSVLLLHYRVLLFKGVELGSSACKLCIQLLFLFRRRSGKLLHFELLF